MLNLRQSTTFRCGFTVLQQGHGQTNAKPLPARDAASWLQRGERFFRLLRLRQTIRQSLVLHNATYTNCAPAPLLVRALCGPDRGRLRKPANLDILLLHNRSQKTILERSLEYVGIRDYAVVAPALPRGVWRNTYKLPAALRFAKASTSEYILYIDADDAILLGDPARAIASLEASGRDCLFSTTRYRDYGFMPDVEPVFVAEAKQAGWTDSANIHLNSGVFVARRTFLIEFLEAACTFVTDDDASWREYSRQSGKGRVKNPQFPLGCGSDQAIFRFLFPRFRSQIALDYEQKLAFR